MQMINRSINILIGDTPKKAVVYQIALRQKKVLSRICSDVLFGEDKNADINLVHKYGVDIDNRNGFNVFFLHFDPYDIRVRSAIYDFDGYLKRFNLVVCLNRKQKKYCDIRGVKNFSCPHGSDYKKQNLKNNSFPVIGLVCDYYGGNVKGERYFYELAKKMSGFLKFKIIGKGWKNKNLDKKHVEVIGIDSYSELKIHFDKVDILYIGSRYEAGPASFPDAVNSNKYVMATPVGMIIDNFIEGESGFYITFDLEIDVFNINLILGKIQGRVLPKFLYKYPSWENQIKEVIGVIDENYDKKS